MRISGSRIGHILEQMSAHRWVTAGVLLLLASLTTMSWFVRLATSPARHAGGFVAMHDYGLTDIELEVGTLEGAGQ